MEHAVFVVETHTDASGKRRVHIVRCDDGTFTFTEERFSDDPFDQAWIPQTYRRSAPGCSSSEAALREARGRVDWLRDDLSDA